jgi:tripartite-type tricarboxylate transporter receptor subunit TctC
MEEVMPVFRSAAMTAACLSIVLFAAPAEAQTYPNQVVRLVVPFSAGSATDTLARTLAERLSDKWKQQVVVENRPGLPGTTSVAKSAPDGYTLMLTSNGHTVARAVNKELPFDPVKDFVGVTQVATVPLVLIINPEVSAKNLQEFIAHAKERPGKLNFASPGLGSTTFIAAALFRDATKLDLVHVPYKGAPESVTSVIRGDTHMYFNPVNVSAELMESGKVRAIAVATEKRVPTLPNVPTLDEAGLKGFTYNSWFGLMAPAGTPKEIIAKVNADTVAAMQDKTIQDRLAKQGIVVMTNSPAEFDAIIKTDTDRYTKIFQEAGIGAK